MSDELRRVVRSRLTEVLVEEVADVFMDHMPPVDWTDLATKKDLDVPAFVMKKDLDATAVAMKKDLDATAIAMKKDLDTHATAMKKDLEVLEFRLRAELAELRTEMADRFRGQTRTFLTTQIALVVAIIGSMTGALATLAH